MAFGKPKQDNVDNVYEYQDRREKSRKNNIDKMLEHVNEMLRSQQAERRIRKGGKRGQGRSTASSLSAFSPILASFCDDAES